MPNIVTAGLGWRLVTTGLAGSGFPSGSTSLIQNPGFEIPGSTPGDASSWTTEVSYSEIEYASFTRPGLDVVATEIPAQQPTLGFTIVHNISEGTVTITQATDQGAAQEDFEEGWSNNEQFLLALPIASTATSVFENRNFEPFDGGWSNDPGFESDFDSIASVSATFSIHIDAVTGLPVTFNVEGFEGFWPATFNGIFITSIPSVKFGTCTSSGFTDGDRILGHDTTGNKQFADVLVIRVNSVPKTPFSITISYFDRTDVVQSASITIPQDTPVGTGISVPGTYNFGVRDVSSVTPDPTNGFPSITIEGDPGIAFATGTTTELDSFIRAEFEGSY